MSNFVKIPPRRNNDGSPLSLGTVTIIDPHSLRSIEDPFPPSRSRGNLETTIVGPTLPVLLSNDEPEMTVTTQLNPTRPKTTRPHFQDGEVIEEDYGEVTPPLLVK